MANHKSSIKRIRSNAAKPLRNRYQAKTTRNAIRTLLASDKSAATENLSKVMSMIDKLAKRNVIHKNKASNLKSGIVKRINAMA